MADDLTNIKDLHPAIRNCSCIFIVLEKGASLPTKDGNTAHKFKVADKTGSVDLTIWNEVGEGINCGDIIRLTKGYTGTFKQCLTLYCGKLGVAEKLGEFTMVFSEQPNMSEPNPEFKNISKNHSVPSGAGINSHESRLNDTRTIPRLHSANGSTQKEHRHAHHPYHHTNGHGR